MSTYTTTSHAELMQNYMQGDILEPQKAFTALQTNTGTSLLFSIDTDDSLGVTKELPGASHGWRRADLSGAQAKKDFPAGAACKTFAAAQTIAQQAAMIHLAMVLNDGTNDHLYLSLSNPDADTSWTDKPAWTRCPFNATDSAGVAIPAPSPFRIAGVFISEAADKEYIVADIVRNPADADALVSRFYLDLSTPASPVWTPHDIAIDLEAASYSSCLGRASHAFGVDGLYTAGTVASAAQLIYTPLYNAFDPTVPAAPARLGLPGGAPADAIAACRNADNSSDLYVVAGADLYYFASTNQKDGAVGTLVASNELLSGVRDLFASAANGSVTVWGLNGSDQVFYLACPQAQITAAGWSHPLAILAEVDAISPYTDRQYGANTFFAHRAGALIKAVKTPATGIWSRRNITLPPSDMQQKARKFSSYTTRIQVTDENGQIAAGVTVSLTATSVTSVTINHLYYVIGPNPIEVVTDDLGTVTIVELTQTLAGTRFTATVDGEAHPINPMDAPFGRSAKLNTVDSLKQAVITDDRGKTRPFVPSGTKDEDLSVVAQSNDGLNKAYTKLAASPVPQSAPPTMRAQAARGPVTARSTAAAAALPHVAKGIEADIGDLFSLLETGVKAAVSVIEDAEEDAWHFVVTLGDKIYYGILNAVEKVVAAVTWLYNQIKIIVEDIIKYLEFLFNWQDILVTHKVIKNVLTQVVQHFVDELGDLKGTVSGLAKKIQSEIDKWAGIPDFDQTPAGTSKANPPADGQNSAPANLGLHHFRGNAHNGDSSYSPVSAAESIFDDLVQLLKDEENTLVGAYTAIKTDIIDQFNTLSVSEIIKRFAAILADTLLQTAENILLKVIDIFIQLIKGVMGALTASIKIPVLSTLYHDLTGDDLSVLDVMCLIAAIPVTVIYKAGANAAPFQKGDDFTDKLLSAMSFAQVKNAFIVPHSAPRTAMAAPAVRMMAAAAPAAAAGSGSQDVLDQPRLKIFGITTGILAFCGSIALSVTTNLGRQDVVPRPYIVALIGACANVAYVSTSYSTMVNSKTASWYGDLNTALTLFSVVKGFVTIPYATTKFQSTKTALGAIETITNVIWNVPVIMNIVDNHQNSNTTYQSLIPGSIGNFAFNFGGIMELPIVKTQDPKIKAVEQIVQTTLMLLYGELMVVAGAIYEWRENQHH